MHDVPPADACELKAAMQRRPTTCVNMWGDGVFCVSMCFLQGAGQHCFIRARGCVGVVSQTRVACATNCWVEGCYAWRLRAYSCELKAAMHCRPTTCVRMWDEGAFCSILRLC